MSTLTHTLVLPAPRERAQRTAARPGAVRLTRRGRAVVFLLAFAVVLGIGLAFAAGSAATRDAGGSETTVITVGTGDTLWDIAAGISEGGDVRSTMERIEELNALDSGMLVAGQRLRVPTE